MSVFNFGLELDSLLALFLLFNEHLLEQINL